MAAHSRFHTLVCLVLAIALVASPHIEAVITCGQVVRALQPCVSYLRKGGVIPTSCCNGIRALNSAAKTTPDRRQACTCIKNFTKVLNGLQPYLIAGLPGKCRVNIPYKINRSINCARVR